MNYAQEIVIDWINNEPPVLEAVRRILKDPESHRVAHADLVRMSELDMPCPSGVEGPVAALVAKLLYGDNHRGVQCASGSFYRSLCEAIGYASRETETGGVWYNISPKEFSNIRWDEVIANVTKE